MIDKALVNLIPILGNILKQASSENAYTWFQEQCEKIKASPNELMPLQVCLAMARRKVGESVLVGLELRESDASEFPVPSIVGRWNSAELARVIFLLVAISGQKDSAKELLESVYASGDEYEKEAILKGLSLLDLKGALVPMAADACRTNIETLFSSIALYNPYPASHFSEHQFNQLVLKALFLGISIENIEGLEDNANKDLSRMCFDFMRERVAAKRDFPPSIWRAINFEWTPEAKAYFNS